MNQPAHPHRELMSSSLARTLNQAVSQGTSPIVAAINSIRARKWLVLSLTMLSGVAAYFVVGSMTPIYRSAATILIENTKNKIVSIEELYGVPTGSREFFQTQVEFMRSREVGMRVVEKLDLTKNPLFDPTQAKPGLVARVRAAIPGLAPAPAADRKVELSDGQRLEAALARYKRGLDIQPVKTSSLVEIRFESPDPELAARIANQTAESYITADLDARFNMQQSASKWLNERLETLRLELRNSERALQAYREEIGIVATPAASMGGNVRSLEASAERLIAARVERAQAEQVYRQVQTNSPERYQVPAVLNSPSVLAARNREAAAEKRFAEVAQSLGPSHPEYKRAQNELEIARDNLRRQSDAVIASIARQFEVARSTERALEQAVAASKGDIRQINRSEGRLNALERDVATNTQVYQTFLARVKETGATSDFRNPIARIVDPAVAPSDPVKPNKINAVLLTTMIGAVCAAALAYLLERSAAVIKTTDEVQEKLGVPLLVAVPKVQGKQLASINRLQHDEPSCLFAEAVRTAFTGIRLSIMHEPHPVISFTSTLPNEGKSTLALSCAIEQARTKRTLLIDADMRKPSIRKMVGGVDSQFLGLAELLAGEAPGNCIQFHKEFNLSILTARNRADNAHDLLMSARFGEVLADLRTRFDLIVIDTPPMELVSDALPIGLQSTGLVYVVRAASTKIPMANRGLFRLLQANVNVLGVMLNQHDFKKAGRYYGEQAAYGVYDKGYYGDARSS